MSIVPIISNNYNVPIDGFRLDYVFQMQLGVSATFTVFLTHKGQQMYSKQITMSGDDYKKWGNDDDYLGEFVCHKLMGGVARIIKEGEDYIPPPPQQRQIIQDDSRSVHNDADIQKIQTLQEQLDNQALKLKTITDMLIGKGLV